MKKYEYLEIDYTAKGVVFLCTDKLHIPQKQSTRSA